MDLGGPQREDAAVGADHVVAAPVRVGDRVKYGTIEGDGGEVPHETRVAVWEHAAEGAEQPVPISRGGRREAGDALALFEGGVTTVGVGVAEVEHVAGTVDDPV